MGQTSYNAAFGSVGKGCPVFFGVQSNKGKSPRHVFQKQHSLIAACAVARRQASESRVNFYEAVRGAAIVFLVGLEGRPCENALTRRTLSATKEILQAASVRKWHNRML